MKRVIRFTRARIPAVSISVALIITGMVFLGVRGLNLGIDFQGGMTSRFQILPRAIRLSYAGPAKVEVSSFTEERQLLGKNALYFRITSGSESELKSFVLSEYATMKELARACESVPGITATLVGNPEISPERLFPVDYPVDLTKGPLTLTYTLAPGDTPFAAIDDVRAALSALGSIQIQSIGDPLRQEFSLKLEAPRDDPKFRETATARIKELLGAAFGADQVLIKKTDFIGPTLATDLASQTISLTIVALILILIYVTVRFRFEYALGAVIALLHDVSIMIGVIAAFQLEFSTITIAAVLTIIGYSLNDTIVIFDRIRENTGLMRDADFLTVVDTSVTQSLSRTLITSLTTLLAVLAIYFFGTGTIKLFALNLIVGIVVGTYSSTFIASPVVILWNRLSRSRKRGRDLKRYGTPRAEAPVSASGGAAAPGAPAAAATAASSAGGVATGGPEQPRENVIKLEVRRQQPSRKKKKKKKR